MHRQNHRTRAGATIVLAFALTVLAARVVWGWLAPEFFPGAVDDGLVAASVGWSAAVKLGGLAALAALVLTRTGRHAAGRTRRRAGRPGAVPS